MFKSLTVLASKLQIEQIVVGWSTEVSITSTSISVGIKSLSSLSNPIAASSEADWVSISSTGISAV